MSTLVIETPFDPQALYSALTYVSNIFNATSWQNLLKMFFMIALINGIISVAIYQKTDYFKQFIIALGCASILSFPIGANLAIKRSDTERMYTINNSKAPSVLIYTITTVNSVTKWFTAMAGSSINSPNYTGMYDAGIGSNANIIRNSMETTFRDPRLQSDMVQFIKECTLYDIRDGAVSVDALINNGNGFDLILNNTSPARFVSMHSTSASPEVKTCQMAAQSLKGRLNSDVQAVLTGKAANFFYQKDVAPLMVYSTAIQSSYQAQLNINSNVSQITRQNMFNHLLEVSGHDIARLVNDPAMAESAAIHMATARTAKKAAFQQSVIAQLGKELLPSMSSWFAIIIIMCFPFVVLIFVVTQFNNMFQILIGYMGTLFWICCWQPIFAIINGLANWELGRQLAKTGAFRQEGIPYGYINTVYDSLLNNHSMVGWMVILTPIIAGMVVYGTYRGFSHLGNSIFSTYSGASSTVGNEMSDGNLTMGNTNLGNRSLNTVGENNTSANKHDISPRIDSGITSIRSPDNGSIYHSIRDNGSGVPIIQESLRDTRMGEMRVGRTGSLTQSVSVGSDERLGSNVQTSLQQDYGKNTFSNHETSKGVGSSTVDTQSSISGRSNSQSTTNFKNNSVTGRDDDYTSRSEIRSEVLGRNIQGSANIGAGFGSGGGGNGIGSGSGGGGNGIGASANGGIGVHKTDSKNTSRGNGFTQTKSTALAKGTNEETSNSSFNTNQKEHSVSSISQNMTTDTHGTNNAANSSVQYSSRFEYGLNHFSGNQMVGSSQLSVDKNVDMGLHGNQEYLINSFAQKNPQMFDTLAQSLGLQDGNAYYESTGLERYNLMLAMNDLVYEYQDAQLRESVKNDINYGDEFSKGTGTLTDAAKGSGILNIPSSNYHKIDIDKHSPKK